ncbi:MAG: hypothetical protein HZB51_05030 [Chloroflexi bacterium]|nr:hypothetical protein [Chloroflexota bacterium]
METLAFIHGRIAQTTILFAFAMGAWAAWNYFRKEGVNSNYWGALIIGEILVIGQGVIGLLMVLLGAFPADLMHFLYGVLVALGWPAVYIYTNARATRNEAAIYALVSFFIFGLGIRAMMTGG